MTTRAHCPLGTALLSRFLAPRFIYTLHLPGERHLGVQSRASPGRAALAVLGKNGASHWGGGTPHLSCSFSFPPLGSPGKGSFVLLVDKARH